MKNQGLFTTAPKARIGSPLFWRIYIPIVAVSVVAMFFCLQPLRQWLETYEAAQPKNVSAQIFEDYFSDPDWKEIYALSGAKDTPYEGVLAYDEYMKAKVGSEKLTYQRVESEIPELYKYNVYLGNEKIAAYTIANSVETKIPQWELSSVEIYIERSVCVTVEKAPGYTVYINDVALDDSLTVRSTVTVAEKYLPEGVHGYRIDQQHLSGLLIDPAVRVVNESGEEIALTQDPETGIYKLQAPDSPSITEEEKMLAWNAALADAKFSMRKISATALKKYFDENSKLYKDIIKNPLFIQKHQSSYIDESAIEVSQFYRYSEDCFSAKVKLEVNVIRNNGTTKTYPLDKTYFFTRNAQGKYLVTNYTNEDAQEEISQIKLQFIISEEAQVTQMVSSGANTVTLPPIPVEGDVEFVGWAVKTESEGTTTMTVRLLPSGEVLGDLEPMILYPAFQAKQP